MIPYKLLRSAFSTSLEANGFKLAIEEPTTMSDELGGYGVSEGISYHLWFTLSDCLLHGTGPKPNGPKMGFSVTVGFGIAVGSAVVVSFGSNLAFPEGSTPWKSLFL